MIEKRLFIERRFSSESDMRNLHNGKDNIACAILAGGQNKRMGRHKAFLSCHGKKFIDIISDNMKVWFDEVFIVTNDKKLFSKEYGEAVFEDIIPDQGPLGALYTALSVTKKEWVFCAACDMPFSHDALLRKIIHACKRDNYDCIVPWGSHGSEPLFALYSTTMKMLMKKEIKLGQLRVSHLFEKCRTCYVDIAKEKKLININTPQEYIRCANKVKSMA